MKYLNKHSLLILMIASALLVTIKISGNGGIKEYTSKKEYADIMTYLQQGLIDKGYEIEKIQPIDRGLAKAGKKINVYRIIFFNPRHTQDAVQRKYPGFSALLPLSITVAKEKNKIRIISGPYKFMVNSAKGDDLRALVKLWQHDSDKVIKHAIKTSESTFKLKI